MNHTAIDLVKSKINEVLQENGHSSVDLNPDTDILKDTPLDSMGLAIVVTKLEEATGIDPFANGFILFRTVGELSKLYEQN
jgi:acyl carrier protein